MSEPFVIYNGAGLSPNYGETKMVKPAEPLFQENVEQNALQITNIVDQSAVCDRGISFENLPLVLRVDDLMKILCIGRNTAYELLRSKAIRSIRIGTTYRVPRDALEEYLKKR